MASSLPCAPKNRRAILFVAAVGVVTAACSQAVGASAGRHTFSVWSESQAINVSPLLGSTEAREAHSAGRQAATFTARVEQGLEDIEKQLGPSFVSAAIDPVVGNLLVVRVTGSAAAVTSSALTRLDSDGGHVRIVEDQPSASSLATEYQLASHLVGTHIGISRILSVARDDMAGRVMIGVDRDPTRVSGYLNRRFPLASVRVVQAPQVTDGGRWGNTAARTRVPVAGGDSIATADERPLCTAGFPVTVDASPALITAGHCTSSAGPWYVADLCELTTITTACVQHFPSTFNPVEEIGASLEGKSFSADALGIDIGAISNTTGSPGQSDCIVTTNGSPTEPANSCLPITYAAIPLVQGASPSVVTNSGAVSGDSDRTIVSTSYTEITTGDVVETLKDSIATDNCTDKGDSGSPLYEKEGGSVDPIGVLDAASLTCTSGGANSFYTNWQTACPYLGVDAAYCPSAAPPKFTSTCATTALAGHLYACTITTSGNPVPSLSEVGALPSGVTFVDYGDGRAAVSGYPSSGAGGSYPMTVTATNVLGSAVLPFTLTVNQTPTSNTTTTTLVCPTSDSSIPPSLIASAAQQGLGCGWTLTNGQPDPSDASWMKFNAVPAPGMQGQGQTGIAHQVNGAWQDVGTGSAPGPGWCSRAPLQILAFAWGTSISQFCGNGNGQS